MEREGKWSADCIHHGYTGLRPTVFEAGTEEWSKARKLYAGKGKIWERHRHRYVAVVPYLPFTLFSLYCLLGTKSTLRMSTASCRVAASLRAKTSEGRGCKSLSYLVRIVHPFSCIRH